MVEGGKATPNASISQTLGPLRINIQDVIKRINERTDSFHGMKIPVKLIVDNKTKEVDLEIGTPPVSELIKKEIGAEKGSNEPNKNKIANLAIEQVIKIANMKSEGMHVNNLKAAVKSVIGSCHAMGVLVEGKGALEINKEVDSGAFDNLIKNVKTDFSEEKKNLLEQQLKEVQDKIAKELKKLAKEIEAAKEPEPVKEEKVVAKEGEGAPAKEAEKLSPEKAKAAPEKKEEKKK